MTIDNSPIERQAAQLARKKSNRASYDRILIVTQGTETEPLYFGEIKSKYRLQTANFTVSSQAITSLQLVEHAEKLFLYGNSHEKTAAKSFEQVFIVFDKDDDDSYTNALSKSASLNLKYINDLKQKVTFKSIPSVPCFELWYLLHFQNVDATLHRRDIYRLLKKHLPEYEKNSSNMFASTQQNLSTATERAARLKTLSNNFDGMDSFTLVHELVDVLVKLKA